MGRDWERWCPGCSDLPGRAGEDCEGFRDQTTEQELGLGWRWWREGREEAVTGGSQVLTVW